jgi:microcystin-dependent protein
MTVNVGEIRLMAGPEVPDGWMICDGRTLDSSQPQYQALYAAIDRTYGSPAPGQFNLPDLRARVPIHRGPGYILGFTGGAETVALTVADIPAHRHTLYGTNTTATQISPQGNLPAQSLRFDGYQATVPGPQQMAIGSVSETGIGDPHENLQPFFCLNFIIAVVPAAAPMPRPIPKMAAVIRRPGPGTGAKAKPGAKEPAPAKARPEAKAGAAAKQKSAKAKPPAKVKPKPKVKSKPKPKPKAKPKPKPKAKPAKARPAPRKRRANAMPKKANKRKAGAKRKAAPKANAKSPRKPKATKPTTAAKRRTRR